ncbi:MAG TPA: CaiB/BaiF CoA-transferase family protein [Acidimicrobiales bacterium]|nr:CaiB/BaiF CoA-transferase family protein [Acidimicrobiales bacterium]
MGPLQGVRVLELAGLGAAPFCCMLLSDLGAEVLRVDRQGSSPLDFTLRRGRRSVVVDLKHPEGADVVLRLVDRADVLVEGFRPGVAERLGVGPELCCTRNPGLVYGRITGWGQQGPLAQAAGHDINYIAVAGALESIGRRGQPPTAPLNLVGDYGGGGMLLALGVVSALVERGRSGLGQVVDAAMVDGASLLMTLFHGLRSLGEWNPERGSNSLDTGAPYYDVYLTADDRYVAVGCLEARFYEEMLERLGLEHEPLPAQTDTTRWSALRARLAAVFRTRTQQQWCALLEGTDACVSPVLTPAEAPEHPHHRARQSFVSVDGVVQPAPAPRFSRTPGAVQHGFHEPGADTDDALVDWGLHPDEVIVLRRAGAIH